MRCDGAWTDWIKDPPPRWKMSVNCIFRLFEARLVMNWENISSYFAGPKSPHSTWRSSGAVHRTHLFSINPTLLARSSNSSSPPCRHKPSDERLYDDDDVVVTFVVCAAAAPKRQSCLINITVQTKHGKTFVRTAVRGDVRELGGL